jgi:hypothetical protein
MNTSDLIDSYYNLRKIIHNRYDSLEKELKHITQQKKKIDKLEVNIERILIHKAFKSEQKRVETAARLRYDLAQISQSLQ